CRPARRRPEPSAGGASVSRRLRGLFRRTARLPTRAMAKLPVNFVLYALYAASAALVGGIGYTFYSTYKLKERFGDVALRKQISADVDKLVKAGRDAQPERKNWRYAPDSLPWWKQFSTVNVTGKLPPKPEETTAPVEPEKPADTGVK